MPISALAKIDTDLAAAAAYVRKCGLPQELCLLTGKSSIELNDELLGVETPLSLVVNEAYQLNDESYVLSMSLSCVRLSDGTLAPYGASSGALKQRDPNPANKSQWFGLTCKARFAEPPEGLESCFEQLVDFHREADENELSITERRKKHPLWVRGAVRFTLAKGGKYGLYVDAIDVSDATWHGTGAGAKPVDVTTLDCVEVDDVTALFSEAPASTKTSSTKVKTRKVRS